MTNQCVKIVFFLVVEGKIKRLAVQSLKLVVDFSQVTFEIFTRPAFRLVDGPDQARMVAGLLMLLSFN